MTPCQECFALANPGAYSAKPRPPEVFQQYYFHMKSTQLRHYCQEQGLESTLASLVLVYYAVTWGKRQHVKGKISHVEVRKSRFLTTYEPHDIEKFTRKILWPQLWSVWPSLSAPSETASTSATENPFAQSHTLPAVAFTQWLIYV